LSFDMDVLDPAFAPGISHHEPGGFSTREVLRIIQKLDLNIVGLDLVEYNPDRDVNGVTAMVSAKIVKELIDRFL
ncbi:MAG: arginase family protein, partial [Roseivirga sp.]|nr:arginase family protein [Roseivirga sp.]